LRDIAMLIERASSYYSLMPCDLLFTGTLEGVAPVDPDDRFHAHISGFGRMDVLVR